MTYLPGHSDDGQIVSVFFNPAGDDHVFFISHSKECQVKPHIKDIINQSKVQYLQAFIQLNFFKRKINKTTTIMPPKPKATNWRMIGKMAGV